MANTLNWVDTLPYTYKKNVIVSLFELDTDKPKNCHIGLKSNVLMLLTAFTASGITEK